MTKMTSLKIKRLPYLEKIMCDGSKSFVRIENGRSNMNTVDSAREDLI